MAGLAV